MRKQGNPYSSARTCDPDYRSYGSDSHSPGCNDDIRPFDYASDGISWQMFLKRHNPSLLEPILP